MKPQLPDDALTQPHSYPANVLQLGPNEQMLPAWIGLSHHEPDLLSTRPDVFAATRTSVGSAGPALSTCRPPISMGCVHSDDNGYCIFIISLLTCHNKPEIGWNQNNSGPLWHIPRPVSSVCPPRSSAVDVGQVFQQSDGRLVWSGCAESDQVSSSGQAGLPHWEFAGTPGSPVTHAATECTRLPGVIFRVRRCYVVMYDLPLQQDYRETDLSSLGHSMICFVKRHSRLTRSSLAVILRSCQ